MACRLDQVGEGEKEGEVMWYGIADLIIIALALAWYEEGRVNGRGRVVVYIHKPFSSLISGKWEANQDKRRNEMANWRVTNLSQWVLGWSSVEGVTRAVATSNS